MARTKTVMPIATVIANLPPELAGSDPKFTPSQVAAYFGVDEKWLAAAREGRKEIPGPGFIKLGSAKNSRIRYPLSEIIKFEESLQVRYSIHRTLTVSSFQDFLASGNPDDTWLFAVTKDGTDAANIFDVLPETQTGADPYRYRWLSRDEFQGKRFLRQEIQISAALLKKLELAGAGDASRGLAKLLGKD